MSRIRETLDLEELVITVYSALDDALAEAGLVARDGKLVPRPGPAPEAGTRGRSADGLDYAPVATVPPVVRPENSVLGLQGE